MENWFHMFRYIFKNRKKLLFFGVLILISTLNNDNSPLIITDGQICPGYRTNASFMVLKLVWYQHWIYGILNTFGRRGGCSSKDIRKWTRPYEGEIKEERFRFIYGSLRFTVFINNLEIFHWKINIRGEDIIRGMKKFQLISNRIKFFIYIMWGLWIHIWGNRLHHVRVVLLLQ